MSTLDLFRLDGKVALVTGAGSGIGRAYCEALADAGARVACADYDGATAAATAGRLQAEGREAFAITADVAQESQVASMVQETVARFGRLDAAFANAGIAGPARFLPDLPLAEWQRVIDVNLTGVFLTLREASRVMVPQQSGVLISTASIYGFVGDFAGSAQAYTAAKGALVNFTRTAAIQLAPHGIRVNAIAPGFIETNIGGGLLKGGTREAEEFLAEIRRRTPLGHLGQPEDLKGVAVFLASDASRYMTGTTVAVDGGWLAW
jgi:2-deoxy-D-gluconate 3-dehydrogenase